MGPWSCRVFRMPSIPGPDHELLVRIIPCINTVVIFCPHVKEASVWSVPAKAHGKLPLDKICKGLTPSDSCPCYWGNHAGLLSPQVEFVKEESGRWNCKALVSWFSLLRSHWHWHFQFKNRAIVCKSTNSLHVSLDKTTSWRNSLWKCFRIFPGLWFSVASKEGPARLLSTSSGLLYCFLICFYTHGDHEIGWRDDVICAGCSGGKVYLEGERGKKAAKRETTR